MTCPKYSTWTPLWYTKTCTNPVFDTHSGETRVFSRSTMKRAHFFPSTLIFCFPCVFTLHNYFDQFGFWAAEEMPGVPCCPMHEQKTKVTCIGQFVKLCCESNADGLRPVCLSLVCTKGQGLTARLCPECPRFLTCAWGLHTVRTSCDVTQIRSATTMCGSSGQSYLVLPRHGFLFAILRHRPFSAL